MNKYVNLDILIILLMTIIKITKNNILNYNQCIIIIVIYKVTQLLRINVINNYNKI